MSEWAARACGGKKRHRSERRALAAARRTQQRVGERMTAYRCHFCKQWHVGNVTPRDHSKPDLPRRARYPRD